MYVVFWFNEQMNLKNVLIVQRSQCFLYSVVFTPFPQPLWLCFAPTCDLSILNLHCIAGVGYPIQYPYDWRGFARVKKKTGSGPLSTVYYYFMGFPHLVHSCSLSLL
jgi:hypothetical protein